MFWLLTRSCVRVIVRTSWSCLLLLCLMSFAASAHTFHTSLTRLEFNPQTKGLEITTQLYLHDLETILKKRNADKSVDLERAPDADKLILAYLQDTFVIKNQRGEIKKFVWVGKEVKGDMAWLYFESPMPEGLAGAQVRNVIFFDLLDDQINRVNIVTPEQQTSLIFKVGDDFRAVEASRRSD